MPIDPLQLPHILKAITDPLSFTDLLSCVLVNHAWNDAITPILWEDAITYRSKLTEDVDVWDYQEYFLQDESRQGFLKNAHHIRALTCQHPQLLSILNNTNCVNLVEVNYVVDGPLHGLPELCKLISRNQSLRAVSVESKGSHWDRWDGCTLDQSMSDFLDVLDQSPNISSVYLGGVQCQKVALRLLKRVRQEPNQIKKLTLERPELLTRSRRGPSKGQAWIARESPMMVWIPGTELWRTVDDKAIGNNGRWENEQWGPLNNGRSEPCTAVFETAQELQLVFSETYWFYICLEKEGFWKQYTHCQQLRTHDKISADRIATFQRHLPNLHKLDLEIGSNVSVEWILTQPNARFSSLRLHSPWYSGTFPMDIRAYSKHLQTLVDLDLDYRNFTMKELLYILQDTPHLQSIRIPSVTLVGTEKLTYSPAWASRNLRKVSLGLYLRGDQPDIPICIHRSLTEEYQQAKQAAENEGCEASAEMHTEEHEHEPAEAQTLQDNEMYYFDVYHLGRHYQHKSGFRSKV
ncbi:hypothetical protein CPB97_005229 [Podila verticillata]|nr:hypothetical protein CPB97_005229 [Podila verticillata]